MSVGSIRCGGIVQCLLLVTGLVIASWAHSADARALNDEPFGGFCKRDKVVHNYRRPLTLLPKSFGVPESGKIGFGPQILRMSPPRDDLIVIGRDRFSLVGSLSGKPRSKAAILNWWSLSRLDRIDQHGSVVRHIQMKSQFIRRIEGFNRRDFGFGGVVEPGLYRLGVRFESRSGRVLGGYQEYFRAVTAQSHIKLEVSSSTFHGDDVGYLRVGNFGTIGTAYSYKYRLWTVRNGMRSRFPSGPMSVSADRPIAAPGMAGECFTFKIPDHAPTGVYEVGVRVSNALLARPRLVLAQFEVVD